MSGLDGEQMVAEATRTFAEVATELLEQTEAQLTTLAEQYADREGVGQQMRCGAYLVAIERTNADGKFHYRVLTQAGFQDVTRQVVLLLLSAQLSAADAS